MNPSSMGILAMPPAPLGRNLVDQKAPRQTAGGNRQVHFDVHAPRFVKRQPHHRDFAPGRAQADVHVSDSEVTWLAANAERSACRKANGEAHFRRVGRRMHCSHERASEPDVPKPNDAAGPRSRKDRLCLYAIKRRQQTSGSHFWHDRSTSYIYTSYVFRTSSFLTLKPSRVILALRFF